ncbi:MAG: hypothetical protein LBD11_06860 [Candidatus Peribacteria bacterium]|nr:hypothetical protein [Candidatus Peribacteria bacterium]
MVDDEEGSCRAICNSGNGGGVNTCVDCSAYTLASCPANGICSVCVS